DFRSGTGQSRLRGGALRDACLAGRARADESAHGRIHARPLMGRAARSRATEHFRQRAPCLALHGRAGNPRAPADTTAPARGVIDMEYRFTSTTLLMMGGLLIWG